METTELTTNHEEDSKGNVGILLERTILSEVRKKKRSNRVSRDYLSGIKESWIQTEGESSLALLIEIGLQDVSVEAGEDKRVSKKKDRVTN